MYVAGRLELAAPGRAVRWHWIDIEDDSALLGDLDLETVPTRVGADAPGPRVAGPLAGVGILTRWSVLHRRIDLGYYLASSFWGRGYATEAARVLLEFAYGSLGVHRVEAEVVPGNDASVRVLERAGFKYEALLAERLWGEDEPQDSMIFRLFRSEFESSGSQAAGSI